MQPPGVVFPLKRRNPYNRSKKGIRGRLKKISLPAESVFLLRVFIFWVVVFSIMRLGMLWRNAGLIGDVPAGMIIRSLTVGARFDVVVSSYILLPLTAWHLVPLYGWQYRQFFIRHIPWVFAILWSPLIFLGSAEWEFYGQFHERFNQLAVQYVLDDPATVARMIWHGFPVLPYLAAWVVATLLSALVLRRQMRRLSLPVAFDWQRYLKGVLPVGLLMVVLLAGGLRGGFQRGAPVRWGDAYFSKFTFANHLALNGIFTLTRSIIDRGRHRMTHYWTGRMTDRESGEVVRQLVSETGDRFVGDGVYPLLRIPGKDGRTFRYVRSPRHLVLIFMESFSADFAGAFGSASRATPHFDGLAKKGILFDRFFSQGTHTHQGLFATVCSFPNLPGFEYLMQNSLGQQPFRSFISLLNEAGYHSLYAYNGSFTWDNQEGFFRNQGMTHYIGRDDYKNPIFTDPTWGVSDEDMFVRGVAEMDSLTAQGPSFAILQTLSNHAPFDLPPPAPYKDLNAPEALLPRLNGIRYSDWALGRFFELASGRPWFQDTLFVILGDHGFVYGQPKAAMDLTSYHVPLLLYFPGDMRAAGKRVHTVASQVDVMPTVLSLMNVRGIHQSWGRDVFRLPDGDEGWAVVKPSGNSEFVGYIRGDRLMIATPGHSPELYRYQLNPFRISEETAAPGAERDMAREMLAYVQSGLKTLLSGHAGVKAGDLRLRVP